MRFRDLAVRVSRFFSEPVFRRVDAASVFLKDISNFSTFVFESLRAIRQMNRAHLGPMIDVVIKQTRFTGMYALQIIGFIAIVIGGLTIMNALPALQGVGKKGLISNILIFVVVREIGPIITGIIIIIRSGSAIASELATQKLNKEIDALELHGINPYQYIVLPRVFGGIISTITLLIYFDGIAFIGGFMMASLRIPDLSAADFFGDILRSITLADMASSFTKGFFFGMMIPLVCAYYGFMPAKLYEIPIFVSRAVVRSLVYLFIIGGIISTFFYL